MADRVLRWYVDGGISRTKVDVGGKHKLDDDYKPVRVNVMVRVGGSGDDPLIIDINDDGSSIFDDRPSLNSPQVEKTWTTFSSNVLRKDSEVTCDIDQIPDQQGPRDLTVELDLEYA